MAGTRKRSARRGVQRSAAQKAATKRMLAANRAKRGGTTKRKGRKKGARKSTSRKGTTLKAVVGRVSRLEKRVDRHDSQIKAIYSHTGMSTPRKRRRK